MDATGWAGGNGHYAGWGRNMPTWHLCKQRNRLWAGGSRVMGRWGVADVMDALAVLLHRTHSFPLACLTSSSVVTPTLSKMYKGHTVLI
jgi:hypothetical protein